MSGLETLRNLYPWPDTIPDVPDRLTGWFAGDNQNVLRQNLGPDTKLVVELGSWQGMSAQFLAKHAMSATVVCIDHWEGSQEHHTYAPWAVELPTLYGTFLRNLWPFKDRLIPLKATTTDGLNKIAECGLSPDLIYIDAAHDTESVFSDVSLALRLFPRATLVGDDWSWDSVRIGVERAFKDSERKLESLGVCWYSLPGESM